MIANIQEVLIEQRKKKIYKREYTQINIRKKQSVREFFWEFLCLTGIHHYFSLFFLSLYQFFSKMLAFNVVYEKREDEEKKKMRKIYDYWSRERKEREREREM